jgi:hypothetical protein
MNPAITQVLDTMAKTRKVWVFSPPKTPAPKVPASVKVDVDQRANELVAMHLKPKHIQAPPAADEEPHNYITDIYTKWYRHYFYFCAKYCVPGPNALVPFFEEKFARLEYIGPTAFTLSFMRYTGEWVELHSGLSLDQCLASIKDESYFAL